MFSWFISDHARFLFSPQHFLKRDRKKVTSSALQFLSNNAKLHICLIAFKIEQKREAGAIIT